MESITSPAGDSVVELQRVVQRKLGRCLLRLQQCELLLKQLVANTHIEGEPHQLPASRTERVAGLHKDTMGLLVGALTEGLLKPSRDGLGGESNSGVSGLGVRIRSQIVLSLDSYEAAKTALKELVDLRNELVHHFLERFNIWNLEGCASADVHLDESYEVIDKHCRTLLGWAKSMDKAREGLAAFVATSAFENLLDGAIQTGSVDWQRSGAVSSLRESESRFAISGWTKLNTATAWIREQHPDENPHRYGCKSWRQVIHESRQFKVRKQSNSGDGRNEVWFRSRPPKMKK